MPNGGSARPAPQEGSSQAPTRPRPPPSYANAAGGGAHSSQYLTAWLEHFLSVLLPSLIEEPMRKTTQLAS